MSYRQAFLALILIGLLPITGASPQAPAFEPVRPVSQSKDAGVDLELLVAGIQRRYASVNTVTARFTQLYRAPGVEKMESGILLMKKPGLMRWEYREPETKLFIADGHNTYLYTPEDLQVMVRPFRAGELRDTPLQFLLGRGEILKSFSASLETEFMPQLERTFLLRLQPRTTQADYAFVVVECDENTFDLRRLVIRELTGNTSEFILSGLRTNVKLENKQFRFKIPKGVEVIEVDDR